MVFVWTIASEMPTAQRVFYAVTSVVEEFVQLQVGNTVLLQIGWWNDCCSLAPPIPSTTPLASSLKAGVCPAPELSRPGSCTEECKVDTDCPSVRKCCPNGCANVCVFPESGTSNFANFDLITLIASIVIVAVCINLRVAIEQLPERSVFGGWIPTCTPDGSFSQTQCDRSQCWCVDDRGLELPQTRNSVGQPNCNGNWTQQCKF